MAVHDILEDVPDDLTNSFSSFSDSESLCVPQDRIEDIELYSIFFDGFSLYPDQEKEAAVPLPVQSLIKRQRSKREVKGKQVWSINDVSLTLEDYQRSKCSHCETTKTPQWRMGPNGPKTLCNACGVRYKSGRLLPEYRPAASPTFDCRRHSNFHRKIMKKRS